MADVNNGGEATGANADDVKDKGMFNDPDKNREIRLDWPQRVVKLIHKVFCEKVDRLQSEQSKYF